MIAKLLGLGRLAPVALAVLLAAGGAAAVTADDDAVARHSRTLLFGAGAELQGALEALRARGNADVSSIFNNPWGYTKWSITQGPNWNRCWTSTKKGSRTSKRNVSERPQGYSAACSTNSATMDPR